LVRRAPPLRRRAVELWWLGFGAVVTGYFAWHVVEMAWDAYRFGEKSIGQLPLPLWIPQSVMALGIVVLTVAFVDEFVRVLRCGTPSYPDDLETLEEEARPPAGAPGGER
ncbi:MAG: C4-dicarboxylate ABC transporter permease, partial [Candidatus Rokuibacteriota bacterium]